MNIVNKTNESVYYGTNAPGIGDCGTIPPGESAYLPYEEKWGDFSVTISPVSDGKVGSGYFSFENVHPGGVVSIATSVKP